MMPVGFLCCKLNKFKKYYFIGYKKKKEADNTRDFFWRDVTET